MRSVSFLPMIGLVGVFSSFMFSVVTLSVNNVNVFWIFLELASLCLIPCFYLNGGQLFPLFNYIVVSCISSSLFLCGVLAFSESDFFLILSFILKLGIFPFVGWLYSIVIGSNWLVVLALATFMKLPLFWLAFVFHGGSGMLCNLCCVCSFLLLSVLVWLMSYDRRYLCCHMMLSSNATLLLFSLFLGGDGLLPVFLVIVVWSSFFVFFFLVVGEWLGGVNLFLYYLVLLACPVTFGMIYKLVLAYFVVQLDFFLVFAWVVYSVSEQLYLLSWVFSMVHPKCLLGDFMGV